MRRSPPARLRTRLAIHSMVAVGGVAALSWEVLWQLNASLALGVSALGTAITLAATMMGITLGSFSGEWLLRRRAARAPIRLYGLLEATIGIAGLLMLPGFRLLETLDSAVFALTPALAPALHGIGVALLLGPPAFAMGATIPVFARIAASHGASLAALYGVNTLGASAGVLLIAFGLIPALGVSQTCQLVVALNLFVFVGTQLVEPGGAGAVAEERGPGHLPRMAPVLAGAIVFCTGFVTFGLEVAWFRSLRAAFQSVTESFAIMLAAVLIPLGVGARLVPRIRRTRVSPAALLAAGGVAILLATPLVERMDLLAPASSEYSALLALRLGLSLAILGPAMLLLGMVLPWLLEEFRDAGRCGWLYGINSMGAVLGSLLAAWVLLPSVGFARSAWLLGAGVVALSVGAQRGRGRWIAAAAGAASLTLAATQTSSLGRDRVPGISESYDLQILAYDEGPDSTASVVTDASGARALVIDGFVTTSENVAGIGYMEMMGRLPMLLHPDPRRALVICFGTGQTANAVREEGLQSLDVVDLNPAVLKMAPHFTSNRGVLDDPRVRAIVMDGRAWLRRADRRYHVITLEPMPPHFAGMNALYSKEFYEIAARKLEPDGVLAQWLPFHLVPPFYAASVAATFLSVLPDSILWIHPREPTGILLGRRGSASAALGSEWPGFGRPLESRTLSRRQMLHGVALDARGLARYAEFGEVISDDSQSLAYGPVRRQIASYGHDMWRVNVRLVRDVARGRAPAAIPPPDPGARDGGS